MSGEALVLLSFSLLALCGKSGAPDWYPCISEVSLVVQEGNKASERPASVDRSQEVALAFTPWDGERRSTCRSAMHRGSWLQVPQAMSCLAGRGAGC